MSIKLSPWFSAPAGNYKNAQGKLLIKNPDYFVTWDIHRSLKKDDGQH
jgi:hypothetical protein